MSLYGTIAAVACPFNPNIWEEGNSVEGPIKDGSSLLLAPLAKSNVDVGIAVGGIVDGATIFNGALASYATPVV